MMNASRASNKCWKVDFRAGGLVRSEFASDLTIAKATL